MTKIQIHPKPNPSLPLKEIVAIRISIFEIVYSANKISACQEKSENKYNEHVNTRLVAHLKISTWLSCSSSSMRMSTPEEGGPPTLGHPELKASRGAEVRIPGRWSLGVGGEQGVSRSFWQEKCILSTVSRGLDVEKPMSQLSAGIFGQV